MSSVRRGEGDAWQQAADVTAGRTFGALPEHLRLALKWPRAERVMGSKHVGPNAERCIHDQFMAVFCPECAAFFCSMSVTEIKALAEPYREPYRITPSDGCRTCHRPWTECEC